MSPLGRAALAYALRLGWPVLPLRPCGKEPLGRLAAHGVHDATLDPRIIHAWWDAAPDANVGLAAGCKWIALDVDPRNGGDETLGELERRRGNLPRTVTQLTGGDGAHYLLRQPGNGSLPATLGPGIDVKGPGGYIVAAPSIHPNGRAYRWDAGAHPLDTPIAVAPRWVMTAAAASQPLIAAPIMCADAGFLAASFRDAGWLGRRIDAHRICVRCPWLDQHSADSADRRRGDGRDSSTVILAPTPRTRLGAFACAHAHCARRTIGDVLRAIPAGALSAAARDLPREAALARRLMRWPHAA